MTDACVVMTTCGSEETALTIAAALMDQGLATCVNLLPSIKSYYYYKGGTCLDEEVLLLIKTRRDRYPALEARLRALHPYELPALVAVESAAGLPAYLQWVVASTRPVE